MNIFTQDTRPFLSKAKTFLLAMMVSIILSGAAFGQEGITKVYNPTEVQIEVSNSQGLPKELEGLAWNRWTSKNFIVCSLNDPQAEYLHKHLELVKAWTFARWGMFDVNFTVPCKLICVDNKDLYKKLFNIDGTKVEIRRDGNGRISETVIFLLIDGPPSQTIPMPLTDICLAEFSQKYNVKFGLWSYKGMSTLNGTLTQIRQKIGDLKPLLDDNQPLFFSKGLLEMESDQYKTLTDNKRKLYDTCSGALCLLIRKEFGQDAYLAFLKKTSEGNPEEAVKTVLKFKGYDHLDRTLKRYMIDLTNDIKVDKTPDSYLQIREKVR